jgi:hypothetical protein
MARPSRPSSPAAQPSRRRADLAPDEQDHDGADRRRDQRAEEAEHVDVEKVGELAADEGTGDADQDVGENAVTGLRDPSGH